MRKYYLDNIKWITVVLVVIYHVLYMYNAEGILGVLGKITDLDVQYYDVFQYAVYPWFMLVLFMVSGISSRLYLDNHTDKEFIGSRTTKLLVPSTIGVFAFQFIQGILNVSVGDGLGGLEIPVFVKILIYLASGIGVLWYIQLLWVYCLILVLIRKVEKGRLLNLGRKAGLPVLIALFIPTFGAAQILNTPIIAVYRIGLYLFAFLMGYFVLSHDEVVDVLKRFFPLFGVVAVVLITAFCIRNFGSNYADKPVNRTLLFVSDGYFTSLAIIGGMARYADFSNGFTQWMSKRSFGLYVFHYMGISAVAVLLVKPGYLSAPMAYLLSFIAAFVLAYLFNAVISRIPFFRWAVLGIKKKREA
ncbi:MAG: acyltransferase [Lachnospiraceae bacterium]|nr:acyltransferase [Lachnospiraceae bacterium]